MDAPDARADAPRTPEGGRPDDARAVAPPTPSSLFTRIVALVLATVAVAQLINLLLLASLAPSPPRVVGVQSLANAIASRDESWLSFRALPGRPVGLETDGSAARRTAVALALRLGRDPEDVIVQLGLIQGNRLVSLPGEGAERPDQLAVMGGFRAAVRQERGWLLVEPRDAGLFDSRERRFILLFLLSAIVMLPAAWAFARRLAEPIEQFADAAERLGRDPAAVPPVIEGPAEVHRAVEAFTRMQERLQAYVAERTRMLAAIAHDLRTPLTRLAFRIEALEPAVRADMARDIRDMEAMVGATLDFTRNETSAPPRQRLELGSLAERVAQDLAMLGEAVTVELDGPVVVEGDPVALSRMLANLIENAVKYGQRARVRVAGDARGALVSVADDGPGVPEAELERIFEPFTRLEASRSRETGGTGLGLAVVRSVARAHGGDAWVENGPEGGLVAHVRLPPAGHVA